LWNLLLITVLLILGRVKGILYFANQADRDAAIADLTADLDKKPTSKKRVRAIDKSDFDEKVWAASFDVEFNAKADGDDSYMKLKDKIKTKEVTKAYMTAHDCTHDDPVVLSCKELNFEETVK
jgi:hypothetical protein